MYIYSADIQCIFSKRGNYRRLCKVFVGAVLSADSGELSPRQAI